MRQLFKLNPYQVKTVFQPPLVYQKYYAFTIIFMVKAIRLKFQWQSSQFFVFQFSRLSVRFDILMFSFVLINLCCASVISVLWVRDGMETSSILCNNKVEICSYKCDIFD